MRIFDKIFPSKPKKQSYRVSNSRLQDYLAHTETNIIIATDASVMGKKTSVGTYSHSIDWSFSLGLPDFSPVFEAELLATVLALRKQPFIANNAMIIKDSLSVCTPITASTKSMASKMLRMLVPSQLQLLKLVWVPGHCGLEVNEITDSLAQAALEGPVYHSFPKWPL